MTPPEKPASAEYSQAEWDELYRHCYAESSALLTVMELRAEVNGDGSRVNPQALGLTLLICMGRLAGRYGFRHLGAKKSWEAWMHPEFRPIFELAFRGERATED